MKFKIESFLFIWYHFTLRLARIYTIFFAVTMRYHKNNVGRSRLFPQQWLLNEIKRMHLIRHQRESLCTFNKFQSFDYFLGSEEKQKNNYLLVFKINIIETLLLSWYTLYILPHICICLFLPASKKNRFNAESKKAASIFFFAPELLLTSFSFFWCSTHWLLFCDTLKTIFVQRKESVAPLLFNSYERKKVKKSRWNQKTLIFFCSR